MHDAHVVRPIVAIYVATLLMSCSLGFNGTQASLYLAENGQSAETIGFLAAIYNLALLVTGLLIPAIVSRYGTVGVCVLGALGMALSGVIFPWMTGFWGWMAARVIFGVGVAGIWIAGEAALNLLTPARMQIRVLTLYGIFFAMGFSLGPALSAALDSTAPSAFWYGGLIALCAAVPFLWLRNKPSSPPVGRERTSVQRAFLRYKPSMILAFLSGAVEYDPARVLLPVYGLQTGLPHSASALLITSFVVGGMSLTLLFGWWSEKTRSGQVFISICVVRLNPVTELADPGRRGTARRVVPPLCRAIWAGWGSDGAISARASAAGCAVATRPNRRR